MHVALLSGEHDTLCAAELRALLAVHAPEASIRIDGRIAWIEGPAAAIETACSHAVFVLEHGVHWADTEDSDDGVSHLAARAGHLTSGDGTAAVASSRFGRDKSRRSDAVARHVGKALVDAGHRIDLDRPDVTLFAWLGAGRIVLGRRAGVRDDDAHARRMEERDHFSPIGLHPRLARALVHLARAPAGGRILDPFCGTGGIVLEAAMRGFDAWGSDLDAWMVQGTMQTVTDAGHEPLEATVFQADIGNVPDLVEGIDAIVTDLPYGGASSTHDEVLTSLYARAFAAFGAILPVGARAVIGCADADLLAPLQGHGFTVEETHVQRVHRSLTRHFVVVKRTA